MLPQNVQQFKTTTNPPSTSFFFSEAVSFSQTLVVNSIPSCVDISPGASRPRKHIQRLTRISGSLMNRVIPGRRRLSRREGDTARGG